MTGRLQRARGGRREAGEAGDEAARLERDILAGLDGVDVPVPAAATKSAATILEGAAEPPLAEQSSTIAG